MKRGVETMSELSLRETDACDTVLRDLIRHLDRELYKHYPVDEVFRLPLDDPSMNDVTFVVATIGGQAVGCGAIRPLDKEHIELKRFYVDPAYRQQGIASRMLAYLESRARQRGFSKLRLETGDELREAVALYRKHGYVPIDRYGEYADNESSRCFEKTIG